MTNHRKARCGPVAVTFLALIAVCALGAGPQRVLAQAADFQIVWVVVGEAASSDGKGAARAGRQLFGASDLMSKTLRSVKVAKVDVQPVVIELAVGEELCLSTLSINAFDSDQKPILGAPLSVAVRQDHKERLDLQRSRKNICVRPNEPGEYPLRLTSLLPAPDGTMRGAQVFLRAKDPPSPSAAAADTH